jgi:hypothetical protein
VVELRFVDSAIGLGLLISAFFWAALLIAMAVVAMRGRRANPAAVRAGSAEE